MSDDLTKTIELAYGYAISSTAIAPSDAPMIEMTSYYDMMMRAQLIRLRRYVLEQEAEKLVCAYPTDWWQAVRQRWAPAWWLKRHPVRMERKVASVKATYPGLIHPPGHDPIYKIHVRDEP